jgi:hypothetical protein
MRDARGRERLVCVVTYTFAVSASGAAELVRGTGPRLVDEHAGPDPATSSVRRPSDVFVEKPGTDVILLGHAHAPRGARSVDVALRVGPIDKAVRVHGPRVFVEATGGAVEPGPARAIEAPVPLVWERAWGGLDRSDPARPVGDPRNTLGRGVARDRRALVGTPAPDIEAVAGPRAAPVGFAPLCRHWQPRLGFAGTYDADWQATRMPVAPVDYDPRFEVTVPRDQWSPTPLRGDEPVEVLGATGAGAWRFALPRLAPGFASFVDGRRSDHPTHLDTWIIDADEGRVELGFRAAIPLPVKYERLERVVIFEKRVVSRAGRVAEA